MYHLLPRLEQGNAYQAAGDPAAKICIAQFSVYRCPSDDSYGSGIRGYGSDVDAEGAIVCYAANFQLFGNPDIGDSVDAYVGQTRLAAVTDDTSNTVAVVERAASGEKHANMWFYGNADIWYSPVLLYGNRTGTVNYTKADYSLPTGTRIGQVGVNAMFQVAPRTAEVKVAQTSHSVMQVLLLDGSIRSLSASMTPQTYWAACTINGGEVLGNDW
jgi:Protein of unknown function (DUF1559)